MGDDTTGWDFDDAELEEIEAAWAEADRVAAEVLYAAWPALLDEAPAPDGRGDETWLNAVADTISPFDDPGTQIEEQSSVMALTHADWLAFVLGLVRRGVGAEFTAEHAMHDLATLEEIEGDPVDEDDVLPTYAMAVEVLAPVWQSLDVLDEDRRLTPLGEWGLPRALHRIWSEGITDFRLDPELERAAMDLLAQGPRTVEELRRQLARDTEVVGVDDLRRGLYQNEHTWELADGRLAHFGALTQGVVLTHRLTAAEAALGTLEADADLSTWIALADDEGFDLADGWSEGHDAGALLAMRNVDGRLALDWLDDVAEPGDSFRAAFAEVLRGMVEEDQREGDPDHPGVYVPDLVLTLRERVPDAFQEPVPPLSELIEAAGFEVLGAFAGAPLTRWYGEPPWFEDEQIRTWRDWETTKAQWRRTGSPSPGVDLVDLVRRFDGPVRSHAGYDLLHEPDLEPLAAALPDPAAASFLRAKAAEGRGEVGPWLEHLAAAHAADPGFLAAAMELADLRSIQGDAREAHRLYLAGGLETIDEEVAVLAEFLQPPAQSTGRNQPCPCGSGKKYKVCHGRTDRHPLPARAHWLWTKVRLFAQQPRQREVMLDWGAILAGTHPADPEAARRALEDQTTLDLAVFAGGLLDEFVAVFGPVLPDDELGLLEQWRTTPLRLLEVTRIPALGGVEAVDLVSGESLLIRDRLLGRHAEVDDLLLGRPLDDGSGELRLQTAPLSIPRLLRARLQELLAAGAPADEIASLLAPRTPEVRTTDGEEMVACEARYVLADPDVAWTALVAELDGEPDGPLHLLRGNTLLGTITRRGDEVRVQTMAVERLRLVQALLLAADPRARLVEEAMEPLSAGGVPDTPAGPPVELSDEDYREIARHHEDRWLADKIPALGGLTPREAATDRRAELVALLRDFEVIQTRTPTPFDMDLARIRRELGLT